MLTPYERYQQALSVEHYLPDPHQVKVVEHLQTLYQDILQGKRGVKKWWHAPSHKGLYIWGKVGVGKTWLMDLFFESLPVKAKLRCHFHDFMRDIHDQLHHMQGKREPLRLIAKQLARQTKILCFDEFFVSDIGDAMILGNLFDALFKEQLLIVMTSNCAPDFLYKDGLQRSRFLPAIHAIKKNLHVLHLPTQQDYRRRELEQTPAFFAPLDDHTPAHLQKIFTTLAVGDIRYQRDIYLYDRPIKTIAFADNIIWFDFKQLCHAPRSQMDYLSIAQRWPIVIVDHVPQIHVTETNKARYLINLIDILYDKKIRLIMTANVSIDELYPAGELVFDFQRTRSRLIEMQSTTYLQRTEAHQ